MLGLKLSNFCPNEVLFRWFVNFIADQDNLYTLLSVFSNFLEPVVFDALKGLIVMYIECDNDALGVFVVGTGNGPKPLLSCGVPDLQLDKGIVDFEGPLIGENFTWTWNRLL